MTIKDCIDIVDNLKPNQYTVKDKVMWLSFIEEIIINEVLKTHEGYDGRYDIFEGYSEDKLSVALIVPSPYDRLYTAYLTMKIDETNGEIQRYNSSKTMFNSYMSEYRKYYNKTHMPLNAIGKRDIMPPKKTTVGLSDAEYENLKRDLINTLTENLYNMTSDDKLRDIVNKFVQDNVQMLKGKDGRDGVDGEDGYTPRKNIDYFDGKNGKPFTYSDFTPEQLESLRGPQGHIGPQGPTQDISGKVDKEEGKGLSTNDFTDDYKGKVDTFSNMVENGLVEEGRIAYFVDQITDEYLQIPTVEVTRELINPTPITFAPTTLASNRQYNFGEVTTLNLAFPTFALDGDVIYLTFNSGATPTALTIDTTNTCDIEFVPEAHTGYEVFGKFNGSIWIVNYSEYTVSEG